MNIIKHMKKDTRNIKYLNYIFAILYWFGKPINFICYDFSCDLNNHSVCNIILINCEEYPD